MTMPYSSYQHVSLEGHASQAVSVSSNAISINSCHLSGIRLVQEAMGSCVNDCIYVHALL